jgi:hypothetical protein
LHPSQTKPIDLINKVKSTFLSGGGEAAQAQPMTLYTKVLRLMELMWGKGQLSLHSPGEITIYSINLEKLVAN